MQRVTRIFVFVAVLVAPLVPFATSAAPAAAVDLGSRWELFVDEFLIATQTNVTLKLHEPVRREIVLVTDQPWEGPTSAYYSVIQDGDLIRIYYRGSIDGSDLSDAQVTCVIESHDGIHFTRPKLGLIEAGGTRDNNVVWRGIESHNFAPFLDRNPACKPDERYKALGGLKAKGRNWQEEVTPPGLAAFASADGLHWRKIRKEPVMTKGAFDSLNLAFWDTARNRYACYSRIFSNKVRAVQSSHSLDFRDWTDGVPNHYAADVPKEHFYTSATLPCPGAEHLLLAFPKRYEPDRKKLPEHKVAGVSDAVFMTSRDGVNWDRTFLEAWARPGLDQKNWTERSNMPAWGIAETGPTEWSLYLSEHYRWPDARLRRVTVRPRGFASAHAGARDGEFTTPIVKFSGAHLVLNYATSAAGSVRVEIQDENGKAIPGFALADMPALYGDELDAVIKWKSGADVSSLAGKSVRLRFALKDADIFALRFSE